MAYHVDDPTLETPRNYTTTRDVTIACRAVSHRIGVTTAPCEDATAALRAAVANGSARSGQISGVAR
jgi:hypothetical protein